MEQLGKYDKQTKADTKDDVFIDNGEEDIDDDLSYVEMSYELGYSVSIDEISGVKYDPEPSEETNNNNTEPFHDATATSVWQHKKK